MTICINNSKIIHLRQLEVKLKKLRYIYRLKYLIPQHEIFTKLYLLNLFIK
jgi:hypothetical protein